MSLQTLVAEQVNFNIFLFLKKKLIKFFKQGNVIQSIEHHFEAIRDYVEEANEQINLAVKLKMKNRCRCCCCCC